MLTPPAALEAILFAAGEPVEKKHLATLLGLKNTEINLALASLSQTLAGRGIALIETEHEAELRTTSDAIEFVKKLRESELSRDLGKAGLETLAAVAYAEGATRGEVDWIRGVNSSASIRTLLLRGLIEGREDERDKRRTRYTLTTEALAHLGAKKVSDLPRYGELSRGAEEAIKTGEAQLA